MLALGITLGACGSISINTGNNLQSLGMHQQQESGKDDSSFWSSTTWVVGTLVFVLGALLNFASFGFAPQSTLASLEAIQFVTNLFFGKWLLGKVITQKMKLGTALTVTGTVLAVVFSSKESAEVHTIDDLVNLWSNRFWIAYIVFILVLAVCLHYRYEALEQKENYKEFGNIMAVIYSVFSALFGTLSVVFAKLLAKLLEFWAAGTNIFAESYTYITLVSWFALMAFWLYRLNAALAMYNPLIIIPLLQANFIFWAITSGGIYFQEFSHMKVANWFGFISGIIFMFFGIFLITPPKEAAENCSENGTNIENISSECTIIGEKPSIRNVLSNSRSYSYSLFVMTGPGRMTEHRMSMSRGASSAPASPLVMEKRGSFIHVNNLLMTKLENCKCNTKSINIEEEKLLQVHTPEFLRRSKFKGNQSFADEIEDPEGSAAIDLVIDTSSDTLDERRGDSKK